MNTKEFSNKFDVLLGSALESNSITLDEYEKSILLTEAQDDVVYELYSGNVLAPFEGNEAMRRYLDNIVVQKEASVSKSSNGISSNSYRVSLEKDVRFIVYESVDWNKEELGCKNAVDIPVVPITHDEYNRLKNNPFRGVSDNRVLRLELGVNNKSTVELISKYTVTSYKYRYIKTLKPIILAPLEELSIKGVNTITECELNPHLHDMILKLAVQKALQIKSINTSKGSA